MISWVGFIEQIQQNFAFKYYIVRQKNFLSIGIGRIEALFFFNHIQFAFTATHKQKQEFSRLKIFVYAYRPQFSSNPDHP